MLDVVAAVGEGRIRYRCAMASRTVRMQVHTVGCVMVYVMGIEVKGACTVIYIAMTLATFAGDPAALQCAVSVMTGGTCIMLDAVAAIYKCLTGCYCCCMAGIAVSRRVQGHIT
jgi:hypothetical protein